MQDLVEKLSLLLQEKNIMLATAESCTGGLLAATLTRRPGASKMFERGYITYSNESKVEELDVPLQMIQDFGAVSAETAKAMAEGALANSKADVSISITGIAGPDGDEHKPVGLVYFGYALREGPSGSIKCNFEGSRHEIQAQSVQTAIKQLLTVLDGQ